MPIIYIDFSVIRSQFYFYRILAALWFSPSVKLGSLNCDFPPWDYTSAIDTAFKKFCLCIHASTPFNWRARGTWQQRGALEWNIGSREKGQERQNWGEGGKVRLGRVITLPWGRWGYVNNKMGNYSFSFFSKLEMLQKKGGGIFSLWNLNTVNLKGMAVSKFELHRGVIFHNKTYWRNTIEQVSLNFCKVGLRDFCYLCFAVAKLRKAYQEQYWRWALSGRLSVKRIEAQATCHKPHSWICFIVCGQRKYFVEVRDNGSVSTADIA